MALPSEAEQAQVVTSPDGDVQIIRHNAFIDHFGCYTCEGVVKNLSKSELSGEIKLDYYNKKNEYVDSEVDTFHLEAGAGKSFLIMYQGPQRGTVKYHKIYPTVFK